MNDLYNYNAYLIFFYYYYITPIKRKPFYEYTYITYDIN